jgi:hypothetical protein
VSHHRLWKSKTEREQHCENEETLHASFPFELRPYLRSVWLLESKKDADENPAKIVPPLTLSKTNGTIS